MGGRVLYLDTPDCIQIDGGTLNRWTGVTGNLILYALNKGTPPPKAEQMDFITGASMVASRQFYEAAGPMAEDYLLYYEEVDWALQRGVLPLALLRRWHRLPPCRHCDRIGGAGAARIAFLTLLQASCAPAFYRQSLPCGAASGSVVFRGKISAAFAERLWLRG
jgi:hypothetical protein